MSLVCDEVPAVHYQLAMFGGSVRVAPYATYGTTELAANMSAASRTAAGACYATTAPSLSVARLWPLIVPASEWLCRVWLMARAVGDPILLPQDELDRVVAKFGTAWPAVIGRSRPPTP